MITVYNITWSNNLIGGVETMLKAFELSNPSKQFVCLNIKDDFLKIIKLRNSNSLIFLHDYRASLLHFIFGKNACIWIHSNSKKYTYFFHHLYRVLKWSIVSTGQRTYDELRSVGLAPIKSSSISPHVYNVIHDRYTKEDHTIWIGRNSLEKGVDRLEKIWTLVARKHLGFHYLDVIGFSKEYSGDDRIKYIGAVQNDKIADYLVSARYFLVTSYRESGIPLGVQEALVYGCKIISSNVGDISLIVGDNVFVYNDLNDLNSKYFAEWSKIPWNRDQAIAVIENVKSQFNESLGKIW